MDAEIEMKTIKEEDLVSTSFCLSEETLEQVRETARQNNISASAFYRIAVIAMLKRFEEGV